MKLIQDIRIKVGSEEISLIPTLHEAIRLEQDYGLSSLAKQVSDGSFTACCIVLERYYPRPLGLEPFVLENLDSLQTPLLDYLLALAGIDTDKPPQNAGTEHSGDETQSILDHLNQLYKLATGWLGWTPQTALESSPAEIILAYQGRLDLLKAIFGSSDQAPQPETVPAFTDANVKKLFGTLGTTKVCEE